MSEENNANAENGPVFRMEKIYVKDVSFESPNAPEVFSSKTLNPRLN